MAEDDELRSLAQELELGKKKKKKKKIALDVVAAEAASLAASGDGRENPAPQPPPSAPQMGGENQTAGATPLGVTEPGMEEDGLELELMGKKKKKKKKIDMSDLEHHNVGLPEPVVAPPPPGPKLEESTIQDLVEKELGPAVVDEFMLPKKKKRRRPNITFEGFDVTALEVELNVEDEKAIREGEGGMENDEDLEPTDTLPWMGTDRDYTYDELLERVFNIMRQKNPSMVGGQKKKLVMKPPQVVRVGAKKTSFVNFTDICKLLHRQPKHLLAFLLAELGTSGSVDGNNQLIIKGKFQQKQIETVLRRYIKEYVTCHTCRSPDTILHKETRLFFLQCETCGSRCSVQSIKSGFQAITKGYRAQMRRMN